MHDARSAIVPRLCAAAVCLAVLGGAGARTPDDGRASVEPRDAAARRDAAPSPGRAVPDFQRIVALQGPAVVNISVAGSVEAGDDAGPPGRNPFGMSPFGRGNPFGGPPVGPPGPPGPPRPVRGQGSGFVLSSDGIVLTNAHVVENAEEVTVKLTDRREFVAKVLGTDPLTDIAVLKIDARDLPSVTIGRVDALEVGEWVLAIGSPFGFENSATAGIVSAKKRSLPSTAYVPFIQTDVAVNPGNSGGPLFNARGEVVGVNSIIYSRTGGYQGLSFAIPIDVALRIRDQIVATGRARHGRLGVGIQEVNQALAESFGLDRPAGAVINSVEPDSPAARAGLQTGDVVRRVNGEPVVSSADLPAVVGMLPPGERVTLEVWRDGRIREITAELGSMDRGAPQADAGGAGGDDDPKLGLTVQPLPSGQARAGEDGGLLVRRVAGPAARAGILPGDVVLRVNGAEVDSVDDVRQALQGSGDTVALLIRRGDARIFVPVRVG